MKFEKFKKDVECLCKRVDVSVDINIDTDKKMFVAKCSNGIKITANETTANYTIWYLGGRKLTAKKI